VAREERHVLTLEQISLTAAHCAKTLIVASLAGNPILRQCVRLLIPGLVQFIAKMTPYVHENQLTEVQLAAIGEIWKAFATFLGATPDDCSACSRQIHHCPALTISHLESRALGVLLPTISLLLLNNPPAQGPVANLSNQTIKQLLAFAAASPTAFKDAAAKLDAPIRELLEQSIRKAVSVNAPSAAQPAAKPQISLRSF
jgi:hypothetical protein